MLVAMLCRRAFVLLFVACVESTIVVGTPTTAAIAAAGDGSTKDSPPTDKLAGDDLPSAAVPVCGSNWTKNSFWNHSKCPGTFSSQGTYSLARSVFALILAVDWSRCKVLRHLLGRADGK